MYADNRIGLGREVYEHPSLSRRGFAVYEDLVATRLTNSAAPQVTALLVFTRGKKEPRYHIEWYTTFFDEKRMPQILEWKRLK